MIPDIKTLTLLNFIIGAVGAGVVAVIWSQNRGRFAGISFWLVGIVLWAAGLFLMILRGLVPDLITIPLANTILQAGVLILFIGLERFTGKNGWQIHNYVLLAVFMAVMTYFGIVQPNLWVREIAVSAITMFFTFQCSRLLLCRVEPGMRQITRLTGIVFAVYAAFSFARMVLTIITPDQSNDFFKSGAVNALAMTGYIVISICLVSSLILMVSRRLLADVKSQEEKFTTAFDSSPYAILLTRPSDGIIFEINDGFVNISGYQYSEIIGKTTLDLNLWVNTENRLAVMNKLAQGLEIRGVEYQFRHKTGRVLTGLFSAKLITVNNQTYILSSIGDITERKRAEDALKEERWRLESIIEGTHAGTWEWNVQTGETVFNETWAQIVGYTLGELSPVSIKTWGALTHPEDLTQSGELLDRHFSGELPYYNCECRMKHKDGHWVWILDRGRIITRTSDGKPLMMFGTHSDITALKLNEEALSQSEERYRTILENMQDSYIEVDLAGNFTFINEATCRNLGYTMEELIGQSFGKIAPDRDGIKNIFKVYNGVYKTGEPHTGFAFKVIRKDGSIGYAETSISLIKNEQGRPIGFRSVGRDVTERKQMEQKLEEMATHDALTGLPNRTLFYDRCGIALANAQRNKNMLVIMTLDLDFFKDVNDTQGHDMGDRLLIAAAVRLTGALRKSDTVARVGGDEFVLLLWEVVHKNDAVIVAEKILEDFRQPFILDGHSLNVTVSIGMATYPENGENMEELLKCSDKLLYTAKQNGRDRFAI